MSLSILFSASLRAVRSLFMPGMFGVMALSVLLTVGVLCGFVLLCGAGLHWAAAHFALAHWLPWAGGIGAAFIAWLLFPGIMPVIVSFFDERIAAMIERQDYSIVASAQPAEFWHDVRFSLLAVLLNIAVLPFYLLIPAPLIFYPLNGYLLGREFFVMAARRHITAYEAEALRRQNGTTIMLAGMALTLLATIPIINLFAPFWGVAVMVHLYHFVTKK